MNPSKNQGFTLLELMVTLTVLGVLLGVGVPGFFDVVRNNRAAANANELVITLAFARSEAIRRGNRIGVCPSADGASCGASWAQGWILFADGAATDTAAPVISEVLRVWPPPSGNATVAAAMAWVRFLPRGEVRAPTALPVRFDMRLPSCSGLQRRVVELNGVGRTTVERASCT